MFPLPQIYPRISGSFAVQPTFYDVLVYNLFQILRFHDVDVGRNMFPIRWSRPLIQIFGMKLRYFRFRSCTPFTGSFTLLSAQLSRVIRLLGIPDDWPWKRKYSRIQSRTKNKQSDLIGLIPNEIMYWYIFLFPAKTRSSNVSLPHPIKRVCLHKQRLRQVPVSP